VTARPSRTDWVYRSPLWPRVRLATMYRDGWRCWVTEPDGRRCIRRASVADHIRRPADAPWLAYSLNNLRAMCVYHSRQQGGRVRAELYGTWDGPQSRARRPRRVRYGAIRPDAFT